MKPEGQFERAPSPVPITIGVGDQRVLKDEARTRCIYRGYRQQHGIWPSGLKSGIQLNHIGFLEPSERAIFCGLMGEYAVCLYLNPRVGTRLAPDLKLRERGDYGVDLTSFGMTLQIKTRQSSTIPNLIRRVLPWGKVIPMRAEGCVFCEWTGGDEVRLLGWVWTWQISYRPPVTAIRGDHLNVEVSDLELQPMNRLAFEIQSRKGRT